MDAGTPVGTRLAARYLLGEALGHGGMADVYDALDERLGRPVAVKLLRPELAANPDVRRRFESEARAAARLSHPNVVAVFDTGEDEGIPFIVMERLPGETLGDRMAGGPADARWIRRVATDVLLALDEAHRAGIVHRDVKPGNILMARDGSAKVADFGIAKSTDPLGAAGEATATNMFVGTPAYVAPERFDGRPATARSDLYSLGVVLYEALAGFKPFTGSTPIAVARAVADGAAAPIATIRPDVDADLAAVVGRAMAADPADRFASAAAMRTALVGQDADAGVVPLTDGNGSRPAAAPTVLDITIAAPAAPVVLPAVTPAPTPGVRRTAMVLAAIGILVLLGILALAASAAAHQTGRTATDDHRGHDHDGHRRPDHHNAG